MKFITARQRRCGEVMFSVMTVCLSTEGSYVTITHDASHLTVQGPGTSLYRYRDLAALPPPSRAWDLTVEGSPPQPLC